MSGRIASPFAGCLQADPARQGFIDEAIVKIAHGAHKSAGLLADVRSRRWSSQTFIAVLRGRELIALFTVVGAMGGDFFQTCVDVWLAPKFDEGDVVISDKPSFTIMLACVRSSERGAYV